MLNNVNYTVIKNNRENLNVKEIEEKITDYFLKFDYILGDYAYGKLRLKGFNNSDNQNVKPYNNISYLDEYIEKYCAYGCHFFVLSKS